jgi:hypothetical protein
LYTKPLYTACVYIQTWYMFVENVRRNIAHIMGRW